MQERYAKTYDTILIMAVTLGSAAVGMLLSVYLRYGHIFGISKDFDNLEFLYRVLIATLLVSVCYDFNKDFFKRGKIAELLSVLKLQLLTMLALLIWLYLIHSSASFARLVFGYYLVFGTVIILAARLSLKYFMARVIGRGTGVSRLLVLTNSERAKEAVDKILGANEWFRKICAAALTDYDSAGDIALPQGIPVVCGKGDVLEFVTHSEVDEVFIFDDISSDRAGYLGLIESLEEMGVKVDVYINIFEEDIPGKKDLDRVGGYAAVSISRNVFTPRQAIAKRAIDIAGSIAGTVLLLIASVVIVPAIRLDSPGPALFKQKRVGRNGRIFTLYKFRSMYTDADIGKDALMEQNEMAGPMFKMADDPRVTRVGRVLRRTSLDELPQFLNVLKGDMSLVGTRPPTVDEYERYEPRHKMRLSMKPGITGLWQISGRSLIRDFDEVISLDMRYIDNWSIAGDFVIILKTIKVVINGTGAR